MSPTFKQSVLLLHLGLQKFYELHLFLHHIYTAGVNCGLIGYYYILVTSREDVFYLLLHMSIRNASDTVELTTTPKGLILPLQW